MNFAQPAWLILLVLLPLLGAGAFFAARMRRQQWRAFAAPRLRTTLLKHGSPLPRWLALLLLFAACAAMIAGLARPQGDAGTRTEKTLGRNVLIALDLSRSMRVRDVKPDRLTQAKTVIFELLEELPNERVGIIGFAGSAYVYAPLTVDHMAVRETVQQIDETWAPIGGSDLAAAVDLAIETLKKTGQKNNALVIISDGEKHEGDLDEMIAEAERAGIYILAIGVGTEDGDFVPNPDFPESRMVDKSGKPVISRLQADVMRKLAVETKGRYAVAGSGMDIPAMVKDSIKDLDAFELEGRERRISIEFYQWLLLPAILFLIASIIAGTRWRSINPVSALLLISLLSAPGARADAVSSARQALENQEYPEAREAYSKLAADSRFAGRKARFHLGEGIAAYRGGDFKHARSAFSAAMLADEPDVMANAQLGLANSLFQLGWKNLTEESYPSDPGQTPDLERFESLVRKRLEKIRETPDQDGGRTSGIAGMRALITNWADAVRHYDSVSTLAEAPHNRSMTLAYLKRLEELLQEEKEQTEQSMPQPQPGEGEPQEGEGEGDDKKPGEKGGQEDPKEPGEGEDDPEDGEGPEGEKPEDKEGRNGDEKDSENQGKRPDETPEEAARRILKENADLEKGPLTPGRREFREPEKDW